MAGQEEMGKSVYRNFSLNTGKHFCVVWVMEHWQRLPRGLIGDVQKLHGYGPGHLALGVPDWAGVFEAGGSDNFLMVLTEWWEDAF